MLNKTYYQRQKVTGF